MKTLKESIYGNLGIGRDSIVRNWVEKYNHQKYVSKLCVGDDGSLYSEANNRKYPATDLMIFSDDILDDGHIPDYIKFHTTENHLNAYITAPGFKSFENFPKVTYMYLDISVPLKDFSTLDNCDYLGLACGNTVILQNLKPKIVALMDSMNDEDLDFSKILKNTKGCTFSNCTYSVFDSIGKRTFIAMRDCKLKNQDALNKFFKSNTFSSEVAFVANLPLDNLSFLNDANCTFNAIELSGLNIHRYENDELLQYFQPLYENEDKITCSRISVKGGSQNLAERLNKIKPASRFTFVSIHN